MKRESKKKLYARARIFRKLIIALANSTRDGLSKRRIKYWENTAIRLTSRWKNL
jgi:hypothetical protein